MYNSALFKDLTAIAATYPTKIALQETTGRKITYQELIWKIDFIAANLEKRGFKPGDRVVFLVRPSINAILLLLAIVRAGGVPILADPAMGKDVFESRMKLAQPAWLFAEDILRLIQKVGWLRRILRKRGIEIPEISGVEGAKVVGVGLGGVFGADYNLRNLLTPAISGFETEIAPERDMLIIFTSGTTGLPKGVVHTHASMYATLQAILNYLNPQPSDLIYANSIHMLAPALLSGATVLLPVGKFSAAKALADYRKYQISQTFAVPAEYEEIITYCKMHHQTVPESLQAVLLGSAPVTTAFLERLETVLTPATAVWAIYGMSEILPVCIASMQDKLNFARDNNNKQGDLLGTVINDVAVRLAEDQELWVSGESLFDRYLGGEKVEEHPTGDLAEINENGQIILLGRKKDMIIRGKYNIYPALFEATIEKIDGVKRCCMLGIYNPQKSDEEIVLVVEKIDEREDEAFRRYLEKELLSGEHSIDLYARPDRIIFMPVPFSGRSSKIDRQALRAEISSQDSGFRI
jgi:acyl-CoA synthetase (AMP-forming)/AMP-acid ligase II